MEGTVIADEVGITFHFKALNRPEKKVSSGQTIPWSQIAAVTYTRPGKYSTGYFRVVKVGESTVPKANRDPYGITANVGKQADSMKLFADQIADRLRHREGATATGESPDSQRQSVKDAGRQIGVKIGARREVRKLKTHLTPGEHVRYVAAGAVDRRRGLVALTDRRLLILFHGHLRQSLQDIPLDRVTAVREKSGVLMGALTVLASNTEMTISDVAKQDMKSLAAALRTRIASGSLPPLPAIDFEDSSEDPAATQQASTPEDSGPRPLDQLEKLAALYDQGFINQAEFEAAKARLLDQL